MFPIGSSIGLEKVGPSVTLVEKKRGRTLLRSLFREQHLKSFWLIAAYSLHTVHCVQRHDSNTSPAGDMSPVVVTSEKNQKSLKNHLFLGAYPIIDGGASVPASRRGVICHGNLAVAKDSRPRVSFNNGMDSVSTSPVFNPPFMKNQALTLPRISG
jgi:hypothetical protein